MTENVPLLLEEGRNPGGLGNQINNVLSGENTNNESSSQKHEGSGEESREENREDSSENSSEDSSEEIHCRICFGEQPWPEVVSSQVGEKNAEGFSEGWIDPCQCSGSQRWVHISCLEKWRVTSDQALSMVECPTCKYRYKYRNVARQTNLVIDTICIGISKAKCCFLILNLVLIGILETFIVNLDLHGKILNKILPFITVTTDTNIAELWFAVLMVLTSVLYCIFFCISFICIRRKKLFFHWLRKSLVRPDFLSRYLFLILLGGLSCLLTLVYTAIVLFITVLVIVLDYVTFLEHLSTNEGQMVLPYDGVR